MAKNRQLHSRLENTEASVNDFLREMSQLIDQAETDGLGVLGIAAGFEGIASSMVASSAAEGAPNQYGGSGESTGGSARHF